MGTITICPNLFLTDTLEVSRSRNKIVEPKLLPKNEPTNLFFNPDDSEILETWNQNSSFKYFGVVWIEKQFCLFIFWEKLWWSVGDGRLGRAFVFHLIWKCSAGPVNDTQFEGQIRFAVWDTSSGWVPISYSTLHKKCMYKCTYV